MKWKLSQLFSRIQQSILLCLLSSIFFFVPAFMVSPANISHPLWLTGIYLCIYSATRAVTHDFGAAKNPALVRNPVWGSHFVVGCLQFIAATLILLSIIYEGLNPLWLVFVIIFANYGRKNFTQISYIFARKKFERRRISDRAKRGTVEYEQEEASAKSDAERRWNRE